MKRKLFLLLCTLLGLLSSVQGVKAEDDVTSTYLTNADFSDGKTGWEGLMDDIWPNKTTSFVLANNDAFGKGHKDNCAETWNSAAGDLGSGDINRTLSNLPEGVYRLSINVISNVKFYLYASINGVEQSVYSEAGIASPGKECSLLFVVKETSNVKIGVKHSGQSIVSTNDKWLAVDDFKLYREGNLGPNVEVTNQIKNWDFTGCSSGSFPGWTVSNPNGGNAWPHNVGGVATAVEYYKDPATEGSFDYYQTIAGLPRGKYTLSASMWHTQGTVSGECGVYGSSSNGDAFAGVTDDCGDADLHTYTTDGVLVTDGSMQVGVKNAETMHARWFGVDWIKLFYHGNNVEYYSVPFTSGSSTVADKWYAFTVPSGGGYKISSNAQVTLKYSQDETKDADANDLSTVAITQGGSNCVTLTAGTFYFKGNANASLNITACTYTLGDATTSITNDSYYNTGTLSSFIVTFPGATTDDTNASLAVIGSPVATLYKNGLSVATSSTLTSSDGTLTATFSDVALTADATDYRISIPAGSFGYAGHETNSAISVNFNTPVVFDGMYYLYDATNKLFLGRGAEYGTRAVVDKYGVAFTWSNTTKLISFVDWDGRSLFFNNNNHAASWVYTDGVAGKGDDRLMAFTDAGDGKVYLQDAAKAVWIKHDNSVLNVPVTSASTATKWTIMTKAEHDDVVNAYPTDNKNNVIDAAGITTSLSFDDYLTTHCEAAVDKTNLIGTAKFSGVRGNWTYASVRTTQADNKTTRNPAYGTNFAEVFEITGTHSQTIGKASLPAGIYKVTVDGFERHASYATTTTLGEAGHNLVASYLSVNGEQVRLADWYDVHAAAKKASSSVADSYPDNTTEAVACFTAKYATSELYIYLDGNTDLEIKVCKPSFIPGNWAIFNNFTLTYYADKVAANKKTIADNKGDITSLINGTFDTNADGWSGYTNYLTTLGRNWRGEGANPFIERNADGTMTTTVPNMPAGTYKVVAAARTYNGGKIKAQVAGGAYGEELTGTGDATPDNGTMEINTNGVEMPYSSLGGFTTVGTGHNWHWISATGTLATDGDLVVNFNCTGNSWMPIDDVHLYCTELDGVGYTQTLSTIDDNTEVDNTGNRSVVTCDLAMSNPNAIISSSAAINGAAGAINNNLVSGTIANMVLYDGYDFTAPVGSYAATAAKLYRSIAENKWVSLILPFVPTTEFSDKKAPKELSEGTLSFADATLANDAPMMVRNTSEISEIVGARADGTTGNLKAGEGAPMVGVYKAGTVEPIEGKTRYVVSGNQMHKVTSTVNIKPFRAYFELDGDDLARIALNLDNATAINTIEAAEAEEGALKDGKYLIDGKIVIVKNGVKYDANGKKLN